MRKTVLLEGNGMSKINYDEIGRRILAYRGEMKMGLRAAAKEISISPATLSRIERGHVADAETLLKVFTWLGVSADEFFTPQDTLPLEVQIAFKNKKAVPQETAAALSELIQKASEEFSKRIHQSVL